MLRFVKPYRAYEPQTVALMTEAFDRTCRLVPNAGNDEVRRKLALLIIRHVDQGERDPVRLSELAFEEVGRSRLEDAGISRT